MPKVLKRNCFNLHFKVSFFSNFRSVQSRLWPWDWTPEAMQKLMEDYDFISKALTKNRGLVFRIRLIELWFNEVTRHNATYPQKRPLNYEEMKSKLIKVLSANSKFIAHSSNHKIVMEMCFLQTLTSFHQLGRSLK